MTSKTLKPAADGGALAFTSQHSRSTTHMNNHGAPGLLVQPRQDFLEAAKQIVASVAREALDRNPSLTPKQKEKLRDAERGRWEGLNRGLALLLEGMAASANPLAFADAVRGATLRCVAGAVSPSICVVDSYLTNSRAQAQGDVAQALFLVERTPARRDQVLDALGPEESTLHFHKLALLAFNPTGKRSFS